jgi:flagellar protein FlaG
MIDPISSPIPVSAGVSKVPILPSSKADNSSIENTSPPVEIKPIKRGTSEALEKIDLKSRESIEQTIQALKDFVESNNRSLKIQVHQGTGSIVVKVISEKDGSVVREIPPEKLRDLVQGMEDFSGTLFNKNA